MGSEDVSARSEGSIRAAATIKQQFGEDWFEKQGRKGGRISRNTAWANSPKGREHMRRIASLGGKASRKGKRG